MNTELLRLIHDNSRETACISTRQIPFGDFVRAACEENACGKYGACWTCPPAVGSVESLQKRILSYDKAIVYTTVHTLEDSFDIEGMFEAGKQHKHFDLSLCRHLGNEKMLLSSGACSLCSRCTYPDAPCRHPERALISVEACGIDVTALAKECGIRYYNGENTVTYFSMLLYREG